MDNYDFGLWFNIMVYYGTYMGEKSNDHFPMIRVADQCHIDTYYNNFFNNDEIIFYNNLSNLSEKIQKFAKDDFLRKKIAKKGKIKYMKYFNSTIVADYIIKKTFSINYQKSKFLWENN